MAGSIDEDAAHAVPEGVLGFQVHVGPAMKVQYRDIYLQVLGANIPLITPDQAPIPAGAVQVVPQGRDRPKPLSPG